MITTAAVNVETSNLIKERLDHLQNYVTLCQKEIEEERNMGKKGERSYIEERERREAHVCNHI